MKDYCIADSGPRDQKHIAHTHTHTHTHTEA